MASIEPKGGCCRGSPAVRRMKLKPEDVCVIIATQGLWKCLSPEEVVYVYDRMVVAAPWEPFREFENHKKMCLFVNVEFPGRFQMLPKVLVRPGCSEQCSRPIWLQVNIVQLSQTLRNLNMAISILYF